MIARALVLAVALLASAPAAAAPIVKVAGVDAEAMPDLRDRVMSLILEAGVPLSTSRDGRDVPAPALIVSVRVQPEGASERVAAGAGYCVGGTRLGATADLRIREAASAAVIWGASVTRTVTIGSDMVAGRGAGAGDCGSAAPFTTDYRRLTTALATSIARQIVFHLQPLRVARVEGRTLVLDRGGALVPLGAMIQVASISGAPALYRVTANTPASATVTPYGAAVPIALGAIARVVEDDEPAANARRFEKAELP